MIDIINKIQSLISSLLPLMISIGVIYFVWGVIQFVVAGGEEAKTKGRDRIIYGVIGFAVILSIWGLVSILASTFGVPQDAAPNINNLVDFKPGSSTTCSELVNPTFATLLDYFTCVIGKSVVPFMFAIAIVFFIWGAIKFFIIGADEEKKREQGKQFMIWGIIALTAMVSVWGLVNILGSTFNIDTSVIPKVQP